MARNAPNRSFSAILAAAKNWIQRCLVEDQSVFTADSIWTRSNAEELDLYFNRALDESDAKFIEKLKGQLAPSSGGAKRLMAEILWALSLFPNNAKPPKKRSQVNEIIGLSGAAAVATGHPMFADDVLAGIGSAGTAYMAQNWREVRWLILLLLALKALPPSERKLIFSSFSRLADWIDTVPETANRQFPHMLRFFAFPDEVERISSSDEKRKILTGFGLPASRASSNRELDEKLFDLRKRLEAEHPNQILDFYHPPLKDRWKPPEEISSVVNEGGEKPVYDAPAPRHMPQHPVNLILFGPPGTGKTYELQQLQKEYTESVQIQDRDAWLNAIVTDYGWRAVIAATVSTSPSGMSVPAMLKHELFSAKAKVLGRDRNLSQTTWGYLQEHTAPDDKLVLSRTRRAPYIFSKNSDSSWSLQNDWSENDIEAAQLSQIYRSGPLANSPQIRRFRTVTFHPSYSYEDFVRGIRPVCTGEDGRSEFRLVDGVFKAICDEARANPSKRFALFIDEINRGNIAKIFGELITLIEPDKRLQLTETGDVLSGMAVQLPGGNGDVAEHPFGVPPNLDIYGTMNTADRSIALLDIALRRRFQFQEMEPNYDLLSRPIEGIDLGALLRRINERLEYLVDRDHRIGHAYLMKAVTLDDLRRIFSSQIVPLLQEYFFDDLEKVALTISSANGLSAFVLRESLKHEDLFPGSRQKLGEGSRDRFTITDSRSWTPDDFISVYAPAGQIIDSEA